MKIAFLINNRNKEKFIGKAVSGALSQTYPCEIIISDQLSTDNSVAEIEKAIAQSPRGAEHMVRLVHCPIDGEYGMKAMNNHFSWAVSQASDFDYLFQCSGDDYSLPDRVKICVEALESLDTKPSAICNTMFFETPETLNREAVSGYPRESGFVNAADGLSNLAYGSVIAGYSKEFLSKVSHLADCHTPDVFFGYLAALDKGFYVVCNPQHVHVTHANAQNTGFQGKMLAASGDELMRLNELNHFQLMALYDHCAQVASDLHPEGIEDKNWNTLLSMIFGQARAWLAARRNLHDNKITPGII